MTVSINRCAKRLWKLPCMIKWLSHEILATIQNWESVKILLLYKLSETLLPIIDLLWGRETLVIMTATVFKCHVNILKQLFKSIISCPGRKDSSLLVPRVIQRLNWWCSAISGVLQSVRLKWQHRDTFNCWGGGKPSSRKWKNFGLDRTRSIIQVLRDQFSSALSNVQLRGGFGSSRNDAGHCHQWGGRGRIPWEHGDALNHSSSIWGGYETR